MSSARPSSSLSAHRPPSSASSRPLSALSQRPLSRASAYRPHSRHARSRITPLCQALVTQITSIQDESKIEHAVRTLEPTTASKGAASVDLERTEKQIRGHALKARINSQGKLAEAMETCLTRLTKHVEQTKDLDQDIQMSKLPDHLQLLLQLSSVPSPVTLSYAETYLHDLQHPPTPPMGLTWDAILAEEPFEGDHWRGIWNDEDGTDSDDSLSPLNSEDLELDNSDSSLSSQLGYQDEEHLSPKEDISHSTLDPIKTTAGSLSIINAHRTQFESLKSRQYWRPEWSWSNEVDPNRPFNLGDASTLGPSIDRALANERGAIPLDVIQRQKHIPEHSMLRELLFALQGLPNIVLTFSSASNTFVVSEDAPRLLHCSLNAQRSVLEEFAERATTMRYLRTFCASIFQQSQALFETSKKTSSMNRMSRTLEAFSGAVSFQIRRFEAWCAGMEEQIVRASASSSHVTSIATGPVVISLLSTSHALQKEFSTTFDVLLVIICSVVLSPSQEPSSPIPTKKHHRTDFPNSSFFPITSRPPSHTATQLLDSLFTSSQKYRSQLNDRVTASALHEVFLASATPLWQMTTRWLKDGFPDQGGGKRGLEDEFFIEANDLGFGGLGASLGIGGGAGGGPVLLDPEFWEEGYVLRTSESFEGSSETVVPLFLADVASQVLASGKATGLLRALDVSSSNSSATLPALSSLSVSGDKQDTGTDLRETIPAALIPHLTTSQSLLYTTLVSERELYRHLEIMQALMLGVRGDVLGRWCEGIFIRMDLDMASQGKDKAAMRKVQGWTDFHFLNSTWRDVLSSSEFFYSFSHPPRSAPSDSDSPVAHKVPMQVDSTLFRISYSNSSVPGKRDQTQNAQSLNSMTALTGLQIMYAPPFPLHFIFTPSVINMYEEIFVMMIMIGRARWALDRARIREYGKQGGNEGEGRKIFCAMRMRLLWVVNTLSNYFTSHAIQVQLFSFWEKVMQAGSLDEMIGFHSGFLDKLRARLFLDSKLINIHQAIFAILDICVEFSNIFAPSFGAADNAQGEKSVDASNVTLKIKKHRSRRRRKLRRDVVGLGTGDWELSESSSSNDEAYEDFDSDRPTVPIREPDMSAPSSPADESTPGKRIDKLSKELDGHVKYVRRAVEVLAGGVGEGREAYEVLGFALEDWDS